MVDAARGRYTHFPLIHKLAHSSPEGSLESIAKIKPEQMTDPAAQLLEPALWPRSRAGPEPSCRAWLLPQLLHDEAQDAHLLGPRDLWPLVDPITWFELDTCPSPLSPVRGDEWRWSLTLLQGFLLSTRRRSLKVRRDGRDRKPRG